MVDHCNNTACCQLLHWYSTDLGSRPGHCQYVIPAPHWCFIHNLCVMPILFAVWSLFQTNVPCSPGFKPCCSQIRTRAFGAVFHLFCSRCLYLIIVWVIMMMMVMMMITTIPTTYFGLRKNERGWNRCEDATLMSFEILTQVGPTFKWLLHTLKHFDTAMF